MAFSTRDGLPPGGCLAISGDGVGFVTARGVPLARAECRPRIQSIQCTDQPSTKSHSALHGSRAEVKKALSRGTEIVLQTLKLGSLNVTWRVSDGGSWPSRLGSALPSGMAIIE